MISLKGVRARFGSTCPPRLIALQAFVRPLARVLSILTCVILVVFNARRLLFAAAVFLRPRGESVSPATGDQESLPDILILVAARDEANVIPDLCRALDDLDYPHQKRRVVLVDDGSQDTTRVVMERCAATRPGWRVISTGFSQGKAAALNVALAECSFGELVYVLDADHRPEHEALRRMVRYFDDPLVAGVSGLMAPRNPLASPVAFYSGVEAWVQQLITMRAKDRLRLAPALLGSNCGYRRALLERCGQFRPGALSEDYDLTLAFYRAGFRVRFAEDVVSRHEVPESVAGYFRQHVRWGRGIYDVAGDHAVPLIRNSAVPLQLRAELLALMAGYLDRVALVCAGALWLVATLTGWFGFPGKVLLLALLTPLAQVAALFAEQRAPRAMWLRLPLLPLLFGLDILAALRSASDSLLKRPQSWTKTERLAEPPDRAVV